jgi:hypothetical protein
MANKMSFILSNWQLIGIILNNAMKWMNERNKHELKMYDNSMEPILELPSWPPTLEIESFTMFQIFPYQILKNQTLSKLSYISIIKKGLEYYYNMVGL